jgi:mRNA interferase MazF
MVTPRRWIPDRGDLIWLTFTPQAGREQAGRRPALVLSPALYNGRASLALVCPITSHVKGYPFEVQLAPGEPVEGCILADHLKNVDWKERRAKLIGRARPETLTQVLSRIAPLLGF